MSASVSMDLSTSWSFEVSLDDPEPIPNLFLPNLTNLRLEKEVSEVHVVEEHGFC